MAEYLLKLKDLWAPPWTLVGKEKSFVMKPLSLGTFALLEGQGLDMSLLSSKDTKAWLKLFYFLASIPPEEEVNAYPYLLKDPLMMKKFQVELQEALSTSAEQTTPKYNRRTVKNPLKLNENPTPELAEKFVYPDMSFLFSLARLTGLNLSDFERMSFKGLSVLQAWLKENPPTPQAGIF